MLNQAVAIDGPAGAGKSTIARALSKRLGLLYVDTGALYRAIGLYMARQGVDTTDKAAVTARLPEASVELEYRDGIQFVLLNGEDVSSAIRMPEMAMHASNVSAVPAVRERLLSLQRNLAYSQKSVLDGRDIGTVVLPDATVKLFVTASPEIRAQRRFAEHQARGEQVDYDALLAEIKQRDANDAGRAIAPLRQAEDAVLLDTSKLTLEESVAAAEALILERWRGDGE